MAALERSGSEAFSTGVVVMTRPRWHSASLVVTVGALALTAAVSPAQAASAPPDWRLIATIAVRGDNTLMTTVASVSAHDAWAIGFAATSAHQGALIRHWDGKAWTNVRLPAKIAARWNRQLPEYVTAAASRRDLLMFSTASDGYYLFGNERHWRLGRLPGISNTVTFDITGATVFSATNAWAFGIRTADTSSGWRYGAYAAHFNGLRWDAVPVAVKPTANPPSINFPAVSAISPDDIWAVAGSTVLRWTGTSAGFYKAAVQPGPAKGADLTSVIAERGGNVWVAGVRDGNDFAADWNGSAWTVGSLPASSRSFDIFGLAPDGRGGLWALGLSGSVSHPITRLWRYAHGAWTGPVSIHLGRAPLLLGIAAVPHTDAVWAVGAVKNGSAFAGIIAISGSTPR